MDMTECFYIISKSSLLITPEILRKVTPRNGEFQPLNMHARECLQDAGSYLFVGHRLKNRIFHQKLSKKSLEFLEKENTTPK